VEFARTRPPQRLRHGDRISASDRDCVELVETSLVYVLFVEEEETAVALTLQEVR
jgi:hypothetical protein